MTLLVKRRKSNFYPRHIDTTTNWNAKNLVLLPAADLFVKTDDDVLVNFNALTKLDNGTLKETHLNCKTVMEQNVLREPYGKYYISERVFKQKQFLPYCHGIAVIFGQIPMIKLARALRYIQMRFHIEDAYIYGVARSLAEIDFMPLNNYNVIHEYVVPGSRMDRDENDLALAVYVFSHAPGVRRFKDLYLAHISVLVENNTLNATQKMI